MQEEGNFKYLLEQFGDIKIMRYTVPGFETLEINQKRLLYFLSEAALCGRDILFHQNYKYNLVLRKTLEAIYNGYTGIREAAEFTEFVVYLKKIWFANGIHHHYSSDKFVPGFTLAYYHELLNNTPAHLFPTTAVLSLDQIKELTADVIFSKDLAPFKKYQNDTDDLLRQSAVNFYEGVTQKEAEAFYDAFKNDDDQTPISFGLNSRLTKKDGVISEETYKIGGLYTEAIEKIVYWLNKAVEVAENETQQQALQLLISYYQTGDLKIWDTYNIMWLQDLHSLIDVVNGFIETYEDPLGIKGTWESVVNFKNLEATKRTDIISTNAQWFEDHSPVDPRFKKKEVRGVSAKVINAVQLGGDCFPSTPIGINLPNADWIRAQYGSKSVTIENITYAHHQASLGSGMLEEFTFSEEERRLAKTYGFIADNLHTDLHECLGHGSGQLLPGVSPDVLKNYHSPLEEARADLFALYYMMDPKLVELGILPCEEAAKAEYNSYIRNGLMTQLVRIELGKTIEQAHMRCRSLIAHWVFEKGAANNVIEQVEKKSKTFFVINDHQALRKLFGTLLHEVQRIKSEGDYAACKQLVEQYGVQIDARLHAETLERFSKLNIAPFGGFVNPRLEAVTDADVITDVIITYPDDYAQQMLMYSANYSYLPV